MSHRHFQQKPFQRALLLEWCALLSDLALDRSAAGQPTLLMNSDVAWQLTGSDPKQNICFWFEADRLVAYAWYQPPCHLVFDGKPDALPHLLPELLAWAAERRRQFPTGTMPFLNVKDMAEWAEVLKDVDRYAQSDQRVLVTSVFEHDTELLAQLTQFGWQATAHFEPHLYQPLDKVARIDGFQVVAVSEDRREDYAAAHRSAWGAGSSFSTATLDAVSAIGGIFDPELCLAVEVAGEYAATTIFWRDDVAAVGNIEPFGVVPEHRGTGVAQALIADGLVRLKEKGMQLCRVYTAGFNHPAQKLYRGSGFVDCGVARTHALAITD